METKSIEMRINEMCKMAERADNSDLSIDVSAWSDELKARFDLCPEDESIIGIDTFDVLYGRDKRSGNVSGRQELDMMTAKMLDSVDFLGSQYDEPDMFGLLADCPIYINFWKLIGVDGTRETYTVTKQYVGTFNFYLSKIWSHGASEEGAFHDMVALGAA